MHFYIRCKIILHDDNSFLIREYYYTVENLVRDVWLRQQWDEEGWLPLSVVASFPRIRALTTDLSALSEALKLSTILEYKDDKIRKLEDWKIWLLPKTGVTVDSPITSPKSNEQNITVSNSIIADSNSSNIITSSSSTESFENSQQSTSNASQNQPTTRTYASLASADTSKQKQASNKVFYAFFPPTHTQASTEARGP